ncbi:MAG: alternative ribosome rescue aminoacyl-tRNA hydrolase ArfB [Bdellovibrionales bacterium]
MDWHWIQKEVSFTAVRSRGPGGQNVNKVSSAALLLWPLWDSVGLNDDEKLILVDKLADRVNREGVFYLRSDEFRDLERNKARCLEKLHDILVRALHRPKKRKPTRPTKASRERRRQYKSHRGDIKKNRRKVDY